MPSLIDRIMGKKAEESEVPICPDHHVEMRLRGKLGRPSRFEDQSASEYTLIYYCPTPDCAQNAMKPVQRNQVAVPGIQPDRPDFSRRNDT